MDRLSHEIGTKQFSIDDYSSDGPSGLLSVSRNTATELTTPSGQIHHRLLSEERIGIEELYTGVDGRKTAIQTVISRRIRNYLSSGYSVYNKTVIDENDEGNEEGKELIKRMIFG